MDKELFVHEIDAASGTLYRVAYAILQDDDACRDALQEAALRAWERRHTLREARYFRTWMTRIVINASRDEQRRRRRLLPLEAAGQRAGAAPDIELAMALAALPEKLRLPLMLSCSEGMTREEIAGVLRVPVTTVNGRIHRAKQALRKELGGDEA